MAIAASAADTRWMRRALALARRGRGAVHPNPRVGCVLVDDSGAMLAEGWHKQDGGPHAEGHALQQAGVAARGSNCYVTLEPCAHQGRTPSCAKALVTAGVRRVVVAMEDPDARVAGGGIAMLRQAGIEVEIGLLAEQAAAQNPGYLRRKTGGLPWLRCKLAVSLDGRTALADGTSRWISSMQSRRDAHKLRAESAAIITGIDTVLADNPRFDIRHVRALPEPPLRVVLDRKLRLPPDARLLRVPGRVIVFCCGQEPPSYASSLAPRAEVRALPVEPDKLPRAVLDYLGRELRINEVLLEAGANLSGAFMDAGLVDEMVIYMAAKIFGNAARPMFVLPSPAGADMTIGMKFKQLRRLGPDLKVTMERNNSAAS